MKDSYNFYENIVSCAATGAVVFALVFLFMSSEPALGALIGMIGGGLAGLTISFGARERNKMLIDLRKTDVLDREAELKEGLKKLKEDQEWWVARQQFVNKEIEFLKEAIPALEKRIGIFKERNENGKI